MPRLTCKILSLCVGVLVVGSLSVAEISSVARLQRFEYFRIQMGTKVRIVLYAGSETGAREAASAAFDRIQRLEEIMSDYKDNSELMLLSREGHKHPRPVSLDLFYVLEKSLQYSKLSDGAFDVTVGPVVALWRQALRSKRLPDKNALARARAAVGYSNIILDRKSRSVSLRRSGMKLDLGGIAKGYAADQALAVLESWGIHSALVDAGGDIGVSGAPPGQPGWRIAIQAPGSGTAGEVNELFLRDCGVATSGDTEQFVDLGGLRYSHIVDPKTGVGIRHSASVTVIAPDATAADALATALSVLPPDAALQLAESQEGVAACIIHRSGKILQCYSSRRMEEYRAANEIR